MLSAEYLAAMKKFEGFAPQARWDYAQNTNGYGTRAAYAGEVIDRAEAEKRFAAAVKQASDLVDRFSPDLDEGTKAALTSLTYNAGVAWMQNGLGDAVAAGDIEKARSLFVQYNKAGGATLDGLVQRRLNEVSWFGEGAAAVQAGASDQSAVASSAADFAAPLQRMTLASVGGISDATPPSRLSAVASGSGHGPNINSDGIILSLLALISKSGSEAGGDGTGKPSPNWTRLQATSA